MQFQSHIRNDGAKHRAVCSMEASLEDIQRQAENLNVQAEEARTSMPRPRLDPQLAQGSAPTQRHTPDFDGVQFGGAGGE
eukprot:NODE_1582_length_2431_cov_2.708333.p13 GENE.NODE_1582_length_2431_cov_2.708333~~NODE_1582_length_2431_cov_2.708333.p13  ORF type:complete len:80 (-),score=20.04 NODE_1582_length_2431_cov_2.708333:1343-1582(-)